MKRLKSTLLTLFTMLLSLTIFAQSDSCATATVITMSGTFTADGPASGGNSTNATNSDWYSFTPAVDGKILASSCQDPNGTDTRLYFHSGTCGALVLVAANDDVNGCSPLTNFASEISDVPVSAGITYYIEWDDNWTTSSFEWDFAFTPKPATDVGLSSIQSPVLSGCGLSNSTPVSVTVGNFGTDPVSNIDLSFSVDATLVASESLAGPIAPGAFTNYTFTATADLSGLGDHTIDITATNANDADPSNDQMSSMVTNFSTMTGPLPVTENFDSYTTGETVFVDFENLATAPLIWETNAGATTSTDTGPDDDVTGGGNYIYMETSNAVDGDQAVLVSKCLDLTSALNPRLEFYYHMYGASIKGLDVAVSVGGVETNLLALSGQQQTANSDAFLLSSHDLTPFVGNIVQLVFKGTAGDDGAGTIFNGDIALDQISITDPLPSDIGVTSIDAPVEACSNTATELVTVTIQNFGSTDETGFDISYTFNGPTGTGTITETYSGTLLAGTSASYTFTATVDASLIGMYTFSSTSSLAGDSDTSNDDASLLINSGGEVLPIAENFDTHPQGTAVFPDFVNDPSDALEWTVNYGATTSTATGPSDDVSGGGGYIYMETSGSVAGQSATICSGCINLTNSLNPRLEFSYHLFGGSIDSLIVYVDDGTTLNTELAIIGQQQTTTADPWLPASVDLSAYSGSVVTVCFQANVKPDAVGDTFNGDAALDEISIIDPLPLDIGVSSIDQPNESCTLSNAESIEVTITNYGSSTETGFDVTYNITGPAGNLTAMENVGALSLAPGASASYVFTGTADMSTIGTYDISANTSLTGDPTPSNDTAMSSITTGGVLYPLNENFESYAVGSTIFNQLENAADNNLDWQVNTGPTTSTDTGPNQDASGTGNYIYVETSGAVDGDMATVCTGCLNLAGAISPQLEFSYHLFGGSIGALTVTIDDGSGLTTLINYPGQVQTASADPWAKEIIDLTAYAGSVVSICFSGSVKPDATGNLFNGDMALDNIIVREPPLCPDPYGLQATNITDVSADVGWIGSGVPGIIEYGPTGFTPGTGTIIDPATNPQVITGLTPETGYDIYITEDCGADGLSITEGPTTFSTNCAPFPFPGNFLFGPIVAPSLPYVDSSSTASCYSDQFSEVSDSPDVFYSFTTDPCANSVTVSLCGSDYDTRLSIINPIDTSLLFTNDDFCGLQSEITFAAEGGTTYFAVAEGFGTTSVGDYVINISETISTGIDAVALASVDPSCPNTADGIVTAAVTGGASPFNYMWSNGATTASLTSVLQGIYEVTVSDNCGGLSTASVTLTDPASLLVDAGATGSICLGESFAIGGVPTASLGNPFPTTLENAFAIDVLNGGFFKHDLDSPDLPTAIDAGLVGDYFAGDFGADGFYAIESTLATLVKLDTASGVPTTVGPLTPNAGHTWTGLAWDGTTFHGLSTDGVLSQLYTIDPTTAVATATVAPIEALPIWLAIDNVGNAYTMDIGTDTLYSLDLTTGVSTAIGGVGFDGNFAQDADFDPKTGTLYLAAYNNGNSQGELRVANLATGNTTLIGTYPNGGEIGAFGIADLPATTAEYIYQWTPSAGLDSDTIPNPIATPTMTTTYVVAVSDNCGNTVTNSVLVEVKPLPPADAGPDTPLCGMSSVTLTASGGIIYSWSTGDTGASITVSPTATTTYAVTVTDVNCSAVDSVMVVVSTPIVPTITVNSPVLTSSAASSYQWYFDNMIIPGATSQSYTATTSGIYSVQTVDVNGCTTQSADEMIVIGSATQIPGVSAFNAFPNPTSNLLSVSIESDIRTDLTLKLLDIVGRVRHEETLTLNGIINTVLDMEQLPPGMYLLQLQNEDGTMEQRIVKQ